jgi:hypothetical protein
MADAVNDQQPQPKSSILETRLDDPTIPEELRGKTTKELIEAFQTAQTQNKEYQKAWDGLAAYGEHLTRQAKTEPQRENQPPAADQILKERLGEDGYQALEEATRKRYAPLAVTLSLRAVQSELAAVKEDTVKRYGAEAVGPLVDEWEKQINYELANNPSALDTFVVPGTLRRAMDMKLGANLDKIRSAQEKESEKRRQQEKEDEQRTEPKETERYTRQTALSPGIASPRVAEVRPRRYDQDETDTARFFGFEPKQLDEDLGEFGEGPIDVFAYQRWRNEKKAAKK